MYCRRSVRVGYCCYCYLKTFTEADVIETSGYKRAFRAQQAGSVLSVLLGAGQYFHRTVDLVIRGGLRILTQSSHLQVKIFLKSYVLAFEKFTPILYYNSIIYAPKC